ncbi:arsenical pump-driving ATPase [Luteitalea sp. TBR-22]|uniref:arsenical pump-driving ATPase n=1 Tax=Luteitalea sp. TBR-22 TaxID=2802971 RepID=UPI001AF8A353|nr:arsenical pump-driving ATPase [Luteitalea sp. TBR-22]BCS32926.1 arsenical pump-driving ATPase [Luteitalea sp. TBR-22]
MSPLDALATGATRILFFTGKGGVGKTSVACATAVRLADAGKRVLLVSTDPASNLDEVLGTALDGTPRDVAGVRGLQALNIDPEAAAHAYRERVVGPYRGVLPASAVARIEEQLSGACTLEIAAFDAFTALLAGGGPAATADHVVFDTAPTGHTLRLLALPAAWTGFIDTNTTGTSCLGPLAGLQGRVDAYRRSLDALQDAATTTMVLVTRPDASPVAEAARTSTELRALGIGAQRLVVNGLFRATDPSDALAVALEQRGRASIARLPDALSGLPRLEIALSGIAPMGIDGLRAFGQAQGLPVAPATPDVDADPLDELVESIAATGRGVVFTMGKGGVGKTTIAAAIAVRLADRGHEVHLTTTDPAAHVAATIGEAVPRLHVTRIDPVAETRAYTAEVLATAGAGLDVEGRALLEEDLRSPCTEEIAVFRAFARAVDAGTRGFVVLDTAPTGHTLLLLDAAEAYHREVARASTGTLPEAVGQLLPRLRDPQFSRVLLVTLPEATPVHEAAHLQADLARAGIAPFAWVVNQSLAVTPGVHDPLLRQRAAREVPWIEEVVQRHAPRTACVAMHADAPVGADALRRLAGCGSPVRG